MLARDRIGRISAPVGLFFKDLAALDPHFQDLEPIFSQYCPHAWLIIYSQTCIRTSRWHTFIQLKIHAAILLPSNFQLPLKLPYNGAVFLKCNYFISGCLILFWHKQNSGHSNVSYIVNFLLAELIDFPFPKVHDNFRMECTCKRKDCEGNGRAIYLIYNVLRNITSESWINIDQWNKVATI